MTVPANTEMLAAQQAEYRIRAAYQQAVAENTTVQVTGNVERGGNLQYVFPDGTVEVYTPDRSRTLVRRYTLSANQRHGVEPASPWGRRRLRFGLSPKVIGSAVLGTAVLVLGTIGMKIGEATGRHFQGAVAGLAAGTFVGSIAKDALDDKLASRSGRARPQYHAAEKVAESLQQTFNPVFGGRLGGVQPTQFEQQRVDRTNTTPVGGGAASPIQIVSQQSRTIIRSTRQ